MEPLDLDALRGRAEFVQLVGPDTTEHETRELADDVLALVGRIQELEERVETKEAEFLKMMEAAAVEYVRAEKAEAIAQEAVKKYADAVVAWQKAEAERDKLRGLLEAVVKSWHDCRVADDSPVGRARAALGQGARE